MYLLYIENKEQNKGKGIAIVAVSARGGGDRIQRRRLEK
jgi:hypothetical protein